MKEGKTIKSAALERVKRRPSRAEPEPTINFFADVPETEAMQIDPVDMHDSWSSAKFTHFLLNWGSNSGGSILVHAVPPKTRYTEDKFPPGMKYAGSCWPEAGGVYHTDPSTGLVTNKYHRDDYFKLQSESGAKQVSFFRNVPSVHSAHGGPLIVCAENRKKAALYTRETRPKYAGGIDESHFEKITFPKDGSFVTIA